MGIVIAFALFFAFVSALLAGVGLFTIRHLFRAKPISLRTLRGYGLWPLPVLFLIRWVRGMMGEPRDEDYALLMAVYGWPLLTFTLVSTWLVYRLQERQARHERMRTFREEQKRRDSWRTWGAHKSPPNESEGEP
jgi:hypothetical protein